MVTSALVPLNTNALPNFPALVQVAVPIVPVLLFPETSATVVPLPSLNHKHHQPERGARRRGTGDAGIRTEIAPLRRQRALGNCSGSRSQAGVVKAGGGRAAICAKVVQPVPWQLSTR